MFHIQKNWCMMWTQYCLQLHSIWESLGICCTAEFYVQGEAQRQDKKTCFSKFQRIKEDMQMDIWKLKGTLNQAAVSALFAVGFTGKEKSRLAAQRIIGAAL